MWLPAWLAGSLYLFGSLVYVSTGLLGSWFPDVVINCVWVGVAVLFLAAAWHVKRWRGVAVGAGVAYCLSLLYVGGWTGYWIGELSFATLCVTAARATFEIHRYGRASQASLFLFSGFMLYPVLAPFVLGFFWLSNTPAEMAYMSAKALLYAFPVVWFVRTPSNSRRALIALAALLLYPAFDRLSPADAGWTLGGWSQNLSDSLWAYVAVMLPIWIEVVRKRRGRPAIVR
jgi:hypothetical protein